MSSVIDIKDSQSVSPALGRPITNLESSEPGIDVLEVFRRQFWLIAMAISSGIALAAWYAVSATVWYESTAKVLVSQRDPRAATGGFSEGGGEMTVDEDVLANHMEIVRSPRIVNAAMQTAPEGVVLAELPSIVSLLEEDETATDYVIEHLELSTGGDGAAKTARSLNIGFEHIDPEDAKLVLEAVVTQYQKFLDNQLEQVSSHAARLVNEARTQVEAELRAAEADYVDARRNAPLLYSGEGAGNVYAAKFQKLEDELLDVQIEQSSVSTRLEKVLESLDKIEESDGSDLEKLALIDSESLERLGMFASLQVNSTNTLAFQAQQADRMAGAQTEYRVLLDLMAEERKLRADFGDTHPELLVVQDRINLVKSFLKEQEDENPATWEEADLSPETLLRAYVGFLRHDLAALAEREVELKVLSKQAESDAKQLIEFELKDSQFRSAIERKEELYAGIVEQLRDLDTASAFSGFIHELLQSPAIGTHSWPKIPICLAIGAVLGGIAGLLLALANDQIDDRFRSTKEVESELGVSILGSVPALKIKGRGLKEITKIGGTPEGEAFRTMRTVLLPEVKQGRDSGHSKVFSITSPVPGDGKSTVLVNLSTAFSQADLSVLVIDADMRLPTAHKQLSMQNKDGLSDVLTKGADYEELVQPVPSADFPNLSILTAGTAVDNPAELLQSEAFTHLLAQARQKFDLVLVDAGPVLALSDPMIIGQRVDGVVLVTSIAKDRKGQTIEAVNRLRASNVRILGCVINLKDAGKEFDAGKAYYGYYDYSNKSGRKRK